MLNAVFRARLAILAIPVLLAIGACVFFPHALSLRSGAAYGAALAVAAVISLVHFRHVGLALTVVAAPIPGLLIASAAGLPQFMVFAALPGFACAAFFADEIAANIAAGIDRSIAAQDALRGLGLAAVLALAAMALPVSAYLFVSKSSDAMTALLATAGAGLCAILMVPLAASLLTYSEHFITRANRMREWRERMLEHLAGVAQPRWGMSIAGVAIVFMALGYFGAQTLRVAPSLDETPIIIACVAALAIFAAAFALTRDWRSALSVLPVLALTALVALWAMARVHADLDSQSLLWVAQTLAIAAVALLFMAAEPGRFLGEDRSHAQHLALLRKGASVIFIFLASALILAVQFENMAMIVVQAIALLFGCLGALLFQPAIAVALETLIPRKSALEARYRLN